MMNEKNAVIADMDLSAVSDNRYYARDDDSPERLLQARYGSLYDEEKGLDEAYKSAMRNGRVFF